MERRGDGLMYRIGETRPLGYQPPEAVRPPAPPPAELPPDPPPIEWDGDHEGLPWRPGPVL